MFWNGCINVPIYKMERKKKNKALFQKHECESCICIKNYYPILDIIKN